MIKAKAEDKVLYETEKPRVQEIKNDSILSQGKKLKMENNP